MSQHIEILKPDALEKLSDARDIMKEIVLLAERLEELGIKITIN